MLFKEIELGLFLNHLFKRANPTTRSAPQYLDEMSQLESKWVKISASATVKRDLD